METVEDHMKITPFLLSFVLCLALSLNVLGQSEVQEPAVVELEDSDDLIKTKWRHVGFHLISDWQGGDIETVLDEPSYGFALTYMKHDRKGIFDGGLDLGFQPIGGFDTTVVVDDNGEDKMGTLTVRNQLVHAHYLLRLTLFQNGKIQPFGEGFAGMRGSLLGARLVLEDTDDRKPVNEVPFFSANFSYGFALGARVQLGKRSFLTARYAEMFHLEDGNIVEVADAGGLTVDDNGAVTSTSTTSLELPPYSVRVGLAINF